MSLISVIVPVYKVEKYLPECLDSILSQSYAELEVILVDDGSPDSCGELCESYAQKEQRIRVIHQENGGLSAARNTGMDVAEGEYITFVDSDDRLVRDCLRCMMQVAQETEADVVVGDFVEFTDKDCFQNIETKLTKDSCYRIADGKEACLRLYGGKDAIPINACAKLYKKSVIDPYRFPVGRIHEDQALVPRVVYAASKVAILDQAIYGYRKNEDGITHSSFSNKRYDDIWAIDGCVTFFESKDEQQIVSAAKKKREVILAKYALQARKAGVKPPKEYRISLLKTILCLKKNLSYERFTYYMSYVHPKLPLICEYMRKIKRSLAGD